MSLRSRTSLAPLQVDAKHGGSFPRHADLFGGFSVCIGFESIVVFSIIAIFDTNKTLELLEFFQNFNYLIFNVFMFYLYFYKITRFIILNLKGDYLSF